MQCGQKFGDVRCQSVYANEVQTHAHSNRRQTGLGRSSRGDEGRGSRTGRQTWRETPSAGTDRQTGRHYPVLLLCITFTDVDAVGAAERGLRGQWGREGEEWGIGRKADRAAFADETVSTTMCVICAPF